MIGTYVNSLQETRTYLESYSCYFFDGLVSESEIHFLALQLLQNYHTLVRSLFLISSCNLITMSVSIYTTSLMQHMLLNIHNIASATIKTSRVRQWHYLEHLNLLLD